MTTCMQPDDVRDVLNPQSEATDTIRAEFRDLPGLCLTTEQAMRLWVLDRASCQAALEGLVGEGVLERDDRGQYVRNRCAGDRERPCSDARAKAMWGNTRTVRILSR